MRQSSRLMALLVLIVPACFGVMRPVHAQTLSILHDFGDGSVPNDSHDPQAGLVQGSDGDFYGTAYGGSPAGSGNAFKISPSGTMTILHSFGGYSPIGSNPDAALIEGSDGSFYGTTYSGGDEYGGTVFKMTPAGILTPLHVFGDGTVTNDGANPRAGLIHSSDGNFYGTTYYGGTQPNNMGSGTVFEMTPAGTVAILHRFGDGTVANDGKNPDAPLVQGSDGNFYGTTMDGGSAHEGAVFKITSSGIFTILHNFADGSVTNDGAGPEAALIEGSDGTFYGTTVGGGSAHEGTVFKIAPSGTVTILHSFADGSAANDGEAPEAALVEGRDGNFYGTTVGSIHGLGTAFQITPAGSLTLLVNFSGTNGSRPYAALVQGTDGSFYGTTGSGGSTIAADPNHFGYGTVFKLIVGPVIASFTPASGPAGTVVTITGTNLTAATVVGFMGQHATTFAVNSTGTEIKATVPVGASTGPVAVLTPLGRANSAMSFTVTGVPAITGFTPSAGPVGTTVTITGTNLSGTTIIGFMGQHVKSFTVNAQGTQIITTVPAGAVTGQIAALTNGIEIKSSMDYSVTP